MLRDADDADLNATVSLHKGYAASIALIEESVRSLWTEVRVIHDYTRHDLAHSERVLNYVQRMLNLGLFTKAPLCEDEAFVLLAATYLHDIGNQCSVPQVLKSKGIELPENFRSSGLSDGIQAAIRSRHADLLDPWIRFRLFRQTPRIHNSSEQFNLLQLAGCRPSSTFAGIIQRTTLPSVIQHLAVNIV